MPTINATNVATVVSNGLSFNSTWMARRDATDGVTVDLSSDGTDMGNVIFTARGITFFLLYRVFAAFDTSGVSVAPSDATLKIYGRANLGSHTNADFFIVKGTQGSGNPATADFDAIDGWNVDDTAGGNSANGSGHGDQESNVTKYSAEWVNGTTAWDESDYNEITLTSAARDDMASGSAFYICILESTHDLNDSNASGYYNNGMYFDDDAGKEMQIDYTEGVAAATDNAVFFGTNF